MIRLLGCKFSKLNVQMGIYDVELVLSTVGFNTHTKGKRHNFFPLAEMLKVNPEKHLCMFFSFPSPLQPTHIIFPSSNRLGWRRGSLRPSFLIFTWMDLREYTFNEFTLALLQRTTAKSQKEFKWDSTIT